MTLHSSRPSLKTVLIASGVVLTLAMGVRHGLGFWMQSISQANGWTRETYSLALAMQNLMWGVFGPFAGMAADRFGTMRVVIVGAISYMAGLVWMALVTQPTLFIVGSGIFIGLALACTAFGAISGIIGRSAPPEQRSWAFGISSAAGSFGQFLMMPVEQQLISAVGWQNAFYVLAALVLLAMIPMAFYLREPPVSHASGPQQSVGAAFSEAVGTRSFWLLLAGYFVCGFQLVFIGVHLPAYLKDQGLMNPNVAVTALALIGLFNIVGSYYAGKLGGKIAKRNVDVRFLDKGDVQKIGGDKVKQVIKVKNGIETEQSKKITRRIKDSKLKVTAAIQGDAVRVTGAKRDDLQAAMALIKKDVPDMPLSFNNFRD